MLRNLSYSRSANNGRLIVFSSIVRTPMKKPAGVGSLRNTARGSRRTVVSPMLSSLRFPLPKCLLSETRTLLPASTTTSRRATQTVGLSSSTFSSSSSTFELPTTLQQSNLPINSGQSSRGFRSCNTVRTKPSLYLCFSTPWGGPENFTICTCMNLGRAKTSRSLA